MKTIVKPIRYKHSKPKVCPFCLFNASSGYTAWGILGCQFCQKKVDQYIDKNFVVIEEMLDGS